ncbi:molybdopterin-dependent oxidoreductase, partial [Streptomyces fulvoviolaceus]|nr:molybdopterin-dependent oxidoreductase [Streptomyces fulvoviolaceus]
MTKRQTGLTHPLDAGTDVPMAHAIGREIIHAGLADRAFIERATIGFEEYRQLVEPWTLSLTEKVTGVPAAAIRELAHAYSRPCRPAGVAEHRNGTEDADALTNLSLLTGRAETDGTSTAGRDPRTPFRLVRHDPPVDLTDERYPVRLTTGRRLGSHNTSVQRGGSASPLRRDDCIELGPEDAEHYGVVVGATVRVSTRHGSLVAPVWVDPALRPGLAFMTMRVPDGVDINQLTAKASCPVAAAAEFEAAAIRIEKLPVATVR